MSETNDRNVKQVPNQTSKDQSPAENGAFVDVEKMKKKEEEKSNE
jgi:hypothetical protein